MRFSGESARCARWPTSRARTAWTSSLSPLRCLFERRSRRSPWRRPTRPSMPYAAATYGARPCSSSTISDERCQCTCASGRRQAEMLTSGGSRPKCAEMLSLPDYVQGAWFDAEGHGQPAPELTVELYWHLCAGGPGVDLRRGKRPHRAVEGPSRHDPGEDVGPQEVAHALDQDGFERAASQQAGSRHPVVAAVVVAVGDYGEPRSVDLVAVAYLQ